MKHEPPTIVHVYSLINVLLFVFVVIKTINKNIEENSDHQICLDDYKFMSLTITEKKYEIDYHKNKYGIGYISWKERSLDNDYLDNFDNKF
jgi:hypothetical protein